MADDRPTIVSTAATPATTPATPSAQPFAIDPRNALALLRLRPGDHLDDYQGVDLEIRRVALGGFGLVFLGIDHGIGQPGVLKTLRPDLLAGSRDPARLSQLFLREALTWVGLWPHHNLLLAQFATVINDVLFLKLDYAEHGSLREFLDHPEMVSRRGVSGTAGPGGRLPLGTALSWAQHVAAGLVALHAPDPGHLRPEPIVHRDLKPENVLLHGSGLAQITDFGLAKVLLDADLAADPEVGATTPDGATVGRGANTQSQRYRTQRGAAMGTPAYMAPEQWADAASAGPAADCYALGLILSELVAGRHALLDLDLPLSQDQWREAHLVGMPRPLGAVVPGLPAALEALHAALLAKRAGDRPTAAEALAGLQAAATALGEDPYQIPDVPRTTERERIFWDRWANTYSRFELHAEALERYDRELALAPTDYKTLLNRGDELRALGRYEEALASMDASLAGCPPDFAQGHKIIQTGRGILFTETGRYAEADEAYAAALAAMPKGADTWFNRGNNQLLWADSELAAGRMEAARGHLERALEYARQGASLNPSPPYQGLVEAVEQDLRALARP